MNEELTYLPILNNGTEPILHLGLQKELTLVFLPGTYIAIFPSMLVAGLVIDGHLMVERNLILIFRRLVNTQYL